jgi:DNA polymerase-1
VSKTGPILLRHSQELGKWPLVVLDHKVEGICREMHQTGLYVHEPTRARLEEETRSKLARERDVIARVAGKDFNPNSPPQIGKLLYTPQGWSLPCPKLTATGQPSTDEDALRILLTTPGLLNDEQRRLVEALWRQRGFTKSISTTLLPFRRRSAGGIVWEDGVLRCGYGAHIPATGRMSSFKVNSQNIPLWLRAMIQPRPGHLFIMADYDQIELRIAAALAQVVLYLEAFSTPAGDPHAVTAKLIYGQEFTDAQTEYKRIGKAALKYVALRKFAKNFVYCMIYGGTEQTAYDTVSKATDPATGELLFPNMTYNQIAAAARTWLRNAPEIPLWWKRVWSDCERNGYVEEPIYGRRRHIPVFHPNDSINMEVQGAAAIIMSEGLISLREVFAPDIEAGLGIVNQMHDAATLEVPEDKAVWARQIMEERMTREYPDKIHGVRFTTKAVICTDFAETQLAA